jgi:hypothetical protein
MTDEWIACKERRPPQGIPVMTKIDDELGVRNMHALSRKGRLWYAEDMYVYYEPTHWRYLKDNER